MIGNVHVQVRRAQIHNAYCVQCSDWFSEAVLSLKHGSVDARFQRRRQNGQPLRIGRK
jgi:hypothetical protein